MSKRYRRAAFSYKNKIIFKTVFYHSMQLIRKRYAIESWKIKHQRLFYVFFPLSPAHTNILAQKLWSAIIPVWIRPESQRKHP